MTDTIDKGTGEIMAANEGFGLSIARPPEVVLQEARQAANALKDVVSKKEKPVIMNGQQYLEFEDWQTLAKFYGVTARVVNTNFIQLGTAQGFEAKADAIDARTGAIISSADAMCLNDEEKWSTRAKYEWKTVGGERVKDKVGETAVPMFQLRSMAQTRACAKALRNVFAWVVVLAGYKPTPAEEMDGVHTSGSKEPESDWRLMDSKFPGTCDACKKPIKKGEPIAYNGKIKKTQHAECFNKAKPAAPAEKPAADQPGDAQEPEFAPETK
jgi:hypothetical protein